MLLYVSEDANGVVDSFTVIERDIHLLFFFLHLSVEYLKSACLDVIKGFKGEFIKCLMTHTYQKFLELVQ